MKNKTLRKENPFGTAESRRMVFFFHSIHRKMFLHF